MTFRRVCSLVLFVCLVWLGASALRARQAAPVPPSLFAEMRWRNIGPLRAGRTKAAAGVPSQPYTFYIGAVNGGVWKTTDAATPDAPATLGSAETGLAAVVNLLQGADVPPTAVAVDAINRAQLASTSVMTKWTTIKTVDLPAMNLKLKAAGLAALTLSGS